MLAAEGALRAGVRPYVVTKGTYASGSSSMAREGPSGRYLAFIGDADLYRDIRVVRRNLASFGRRVIAAYSIE